MISQLINSLFIGILVADVLERRYPNQFQNFMVNISFNCILYYSKCQIFLSKNINRINKIIDSNPFLLKLKNDVNRLMILNKNDTDDISKVKYIKNGEILDDPSLNEYSDYDFCIYSYLNSDSPLIRKVIVNKDRSPPTYVTNSDTKFILLELSVGDDKYKIDFKTDTYSFYIVDNDFNEKFFIYYFKQILKINRWISETDKFSLKIIDQNVNCEEIDFRKQKYSIILKKNEYDILVTNHDEEKD